MAYRKKKRTYSKRRKFIKRNRRYRKRSTKPTTAIQKTLGFADRTRVKLVYSWYGQLQSTIGATGFIYFRGNSIYDPEDILGGGQPADFDIYKLFYYNYVVHGSSMSVKLMNGNAANSSAIRFAMVPTPAATPSSLSPEEVAEQPYAKYVTLPNYGGSRKLSAYMSTAKMVGRPKVAIIADDQYQAPVSSNPTYTWFWNVCYKAADDGAITNVYAGIRFVYYVEFFNRKYSVDDTADNPED